MLEFTIVFIHISFRIFLLNFVSMPASLNASNIFIIRPVFLPSNSPITVFPFPVCLIRPGFWNIEPCVVVPAIICFRTAIFPILSILSNPFWKDRIIVFLSIIFRAFFNADSVSYDFTVIIMRSGQIFKSLIECSAGILFLNCVMRLFT